MDSQLGLSGALQGAARYSLINIPEPVAAADANFDRAISREEFRAAAAARFALLDQRKSGGILLSELRPILAANWAAVKNHKRDDKAYDVRVGNPLPPGN